MPVIPIHSKAEWDNQLAANADRVVVVDFTATWCGPCRMIGPYFAELSDTDEFKSVVFLKVDVDEVEAVAADAKISAMPTFQVYKGGQMVDELVGAAKDRLVELIKKHI